MPAGVVVSSPCWRRNRSILSACSSDRKPTKSCRLRPNRSTDHAMTMSNSRRAASRHSLSNAGRLSRQSRPYSITSSARVRSAGGLRDQLRRKPWPRRSTSWTSITSVAVAILVNAPTLGGWYLLQGQAVAISRTTGIYALLFSGLSRRKGERGEIGVTRIECSRTQ